MSAAALPRNTHPFSLTRLRRERRIVPVLVEIGTAGAISRIRRCQYFCWQWASRQTLADAATTRPAESTGRGPSNCGSFWPPALRFQSIAKPSLHRANVQTLTRPAAARPSGCHPYHHAADPCHLTQPVASAFAHTGRPFLLGISAIDMWSYGTYRNVTLHPSRVRSRMA